MNNIDLMNYWIKSSDNDYDVMLDLYDDYQMEFLAKCTDEYTEIQIRNIEVIRKWLKELLAQK